ncbi:MAG: hypothetical protein SVY53_10710 [Chloroflexota bacterium]|nr:hypothetical protein [Chloroflexota bacterium]
MRDVELLIRRARDMGACFVLEEDKVKVRAQNRLPDDLIAELCKLKPQVISVLKQQCKSDDCWALEEWRKSSIPSWKRILAESRAQGDKKREEYALWMLQEVLKADEIQEECE